MIKTVFPKSVFTVQKNLEKLLATDKFSMSLTSQKQIQNWLNGMATRHSSDMEIPSSPTISKRQLKKIEQESLRRSKEAWQYTSNYVESGAELNPFFIHNVLSILEPEQELSKVTGFRTCDIQVTDSTAYRPSPSKIASEIHKMKYVLLNLQTPLEKSIFSHYHLARIHPGEDGNGRLARIVQNAYLYDAGYLPIIIPKRQREIYIDLMEHTHTQFYNNSTRYLVEFSNFLVDKLQESIDIYASYNLDISAEEIKPRKKNKQNIPKKNIKKENIMPKQKTHYYRFKK